MVNWQEINTVLLDMDGTLLDLHFDNYFWREHVPLRYAEKHQISVEHAKDTLFPIFRKKEGTMEWYCVDYWTQTLDLDIALLKAEVDHLIAIHPFVLEFLDRVRKAGKTLALVTNAHQKSLMLKLERTALHNHLDHVICAHEFGMPKENPLFWDKLQTRLPFENASTLLIDDSLPVLRSARGYGIRWLLSVISPDSKTPARAIDEFEAIESFNQILPAA
ncbi:MAG: GMP/IMP nucleotidase [Gammaproteobacteria bacterium]|nr:GMP/IMP nucleotidase [Gammaproteobacteria bacterium]